MSGARVWEAVKSGDFDGVRNYCETDALNTYLLYLRFELLRGRFDASGLAAAFEGIRQALRDDGRSHLQEFLERWDAAAGRGAETD